MSQNPNLKESVKSRLKEYKEVSMMTSSNSAFDPQLSFLAPFIKKSLDKGGKLYDESLKLTNFDVALKKTKVTELKTKYTKEFIEKNMKKDYDGLGEVRFKGKSKWGEDGYDEKQEVEKEDNDDKEKGFKKLSKKKQQRLEEKSKKLLRVKKRKKKKHKEASDIEGFGDQDDLLELAGKSGGWGGEGFTEREKEETGISNTKNEINLPKSKQKKRKKKKSKKEKKQKKNKKKNRTKAKEKAKALFGEDNKDQKSTEKTMKVENAIDDKFADFDLLSGQTNSVPAKKESSNMLKPFDIDIDEYQEKWEELEDNQEDFKISFNGSISKFKKKLKKLGFAILDVQDSEIICAGLHNSVEVLMYIGYDSDGSDGIIASKDSNITSLVISALN
jgi:hypothetical protein